MSKNVRRVYVEKKKGFNVEAQNLFNDLKANLGLNSLKAIRILNCYDVSGISDEEFKVAADNIFSEKNVDDVYYENFSFSSNQYAFATEFLPGQYDQRADSAAECVQLITAGVRPLVHTSKVIILEGNLSQEELKKIKDYYINPVDSREASLDKPEKLEENYELPQSVEILEGFIDLDLDGLKSLYKSLNLAMSFDDIKLCQHYFKNEEKRNPSITEIRVLDTYWSDHCRHTTFQTEIQSVKIDEGRFNKAIEESYKKYLDSHLSVYPKKNRPVTLMDLATIAMKHLKKQGKLKNLDESEEINACSIKVNIPIDGKDEEWLIMFKNETHNHPTEIEPFGGAATCLGGAIRDPLSGRSYVYQAMRVTGSGDPRTSIKDTLSGKLPQKKITTEAAHGYSSYGNQIGLATGMVNEVYDEGYIAKRMEIGAVVGAAPAENVIRKVPVGGDIVILLGGRTGRDGCGGATGSSKKHTEKSISTCGAEVQKGNPPTERKIQRLFRNPEVSTLIKRCNDFGAGGVSVAIGELADGLDINLDVVTKKYEGLDGTELAISESQERMAVVVTADSADKFINLCNNENLEATAVATVTDTNRLVLNWKGNAIVDISRDFLNSNGAKAYSDVAIAEVKDIDSIFKAKKSDKPLKEAWLNKLSELNVCSQKGLVERFDSTIGANTVLMPYGGKYQLTPNEAMAAKVPVLNGDTTVATVMSYGFNPKISKLSPFHGAVYSVVESAARVVAVGGKLESTKLTFQEYFERLGTDPYRWGKPFAALLGAFHAQEELEIAAIGGKDSMSGSFNDLDVPPTLVSFALDVVKDADIIVSQEFKAANHKVVLLKSAINDEMLPEFDKLKTNFNLISKLIEQHKAASCSSIRYGGICEAVSKMSFGNKIGFNFDNSFDEEELFIPYYGSFIIELNDDVNIEKEFSGKDYSVLGITSKDSRIKLNSMNIAVDEAIEAWISPLETIFPTRTSEEKRAYEERLYNETNKHSFGLSIGSAKPRVFIPVFPGTNCEYDSARAFEKAGAVSNTYVFKNLKPENIKESVRAMEKAIRESQILMIPGGFSAGDEPEGSGKFIANVFRNPELKDAVMDLIKNRDGLILGICNGFQALIKLGLVPYGEITDLDVDAPTLTYNNIGRHVSCIVNTKIVSNKSPWLNNVKVGDIHSIAVSHGEGRFVGTDRVINKLFENGQVATQYVDLDGNAVNYMPFNPNGSMYAIEGITSPDGRIFGKMGHSERRGQFVHKNIMGEKDQKLFDAGVKYFK
ncbi:phosphoribosylformylglycinamidine synthase [Clostridium oryzae]|uniref:Phosphoribosylformylglycinamidine synthase n=1 Tax=Clostridium oryzae TaxID=1450648 RepID=A0A1V4IBZ9_9CLOT|nr:phosphoribosylformylglycinamidine synthase [Clostridium oryzae]OPJ57528.1 phosphoribosylformylglycinamidine synthase [Clostridium oryzae]